MTEDFAKLYGSLDLGYDPWHRCLVGGPRSTPMKAFYATRTILSTHSCVQRFLFNRLCRQEFIALLLRTINFLNSGIFYGIYQTYILLYQLVRFYLRDNALTIYTDPKEQLDWNACLCLNLLDSVLNPTNLQLYIPCKLTRN